MTERQLRTECDILSDLGLITKHTTGMSITEKGEEFLSEVNSSLVNDTFVKERNLIKKYFSIKQVHVVAGDFVSSEVTRAEMTELLLDKVNKQITKECVIGVSGGSTMYYVAGKANETFGYKKNVIIPTKIGGVFEKSKNFGFVKPDDKKNFKKDIFIPKAFSKNARNGQKVVVEIIKESVDGKKSEGKIVEILGFPDQAGIDMLSIIKQFDLPPEFSKEVINEAKSVSLEPISLKYRRDLRDQEIFTIDGEDAKDLDDAVCVKKLSDGNYELGVHIADVSHYVRENTEINREAVNRSTSVYMLDRVIPMLPVELSNGCCSLNEGVDRYAMSCVMKINKRGDVVDADVFKSVINVTKRMNYHEVQVDIDRNNEEIVSQYDDEKKKYANDNIVADEKYLEHLDLMAELAQILKNRRIEKGYSLRQVETLLQGKGVNILLLLYKN